MSVKKYSKSKLRRVLKSINCWKDEWDVTPIHIAKDQIKVKLTALKNALRFRTATSQENVLLNIEDKI